MNRFRPPVTSCWLGSVPYREAWDLQRSLVERIREGGAGDTLLLLEHPHVFTMGRKASDEHVLWDTAERERRQVELIATDRGGDVTYHGPGQLVGYPILDLRNHGGDLLAYLRTLEGSLISYLAELGIESGPVPGLTGVWTGGEKIAALGVKNTSGIVSHGFALNLATDMAYFGGIVPCGLDDKSTTSVKARLGSAPAVEEAATAYGRHFETAFGVALAWNRTGAISVGT